MSHRPLTILALTALLFAGCQTWNPGGSTYTEKKGKFSVTAPAGWQYATTLGPDFLTSKDGPVLQRIAVEHRELDKALPNSKRPLSATIDAFQLAEAIIGDLRADRNLLAFTLTENTPATIGGVSGCKLTYTFETADKLRLTETLYCCLHDRQLWLLSYRAPTRHYFDRDVSTFEQTVKSFRFGQG